MEETVLPAYFGEWLKCQRRQLDLTQAELAQRAGCSVPALRKIEAGERRPSKQLAGLLAKSLEIPHENQLTFIKVARGELSVDWLKSSAPVHAAYDKINPEPFTFINNLPIQLTPLIGREPELAALGKLLNDSRCRLLSITGMGGIGKTRLAVELAFQQQALFPGGVYYVPLASLNSAEFIVSATADVLGLSLSGVLDPKEQLLNHLAARTKQALLLVLDNLEHLLIPSIQGDNQAEAAVLLAELLQKLPNLKILTTSRERISIQGEWAFELHGLPFPTNHQFTDMESYSAAALFLQRARQAKADFDVLPDEQPWLARICQLVEGTPLAIELAAAWVGVLSMKEVAKEIASDLDFLKTSMRDIPERHRSLRATFDHSWKLLSVEEQQGLCRLAVFRGGFQREAAEQVAGASLSILMSLFSKSLLVRRENGRYDLHEVVRQYALTRVTNDPQYEVTLERHCNFYLRIVQEQEKALEGATQFKAIQVLEEELDNLRAAMVWGLENCHVECSLKIAVALRPFWLTQGYWHEGLEWLERGLGVPGIIPDVVKAKALTNAGWLSRYLGDFPRAIAMLQESLVLWRQINDHIGLALTLFNLGASVIRQGDITKATAMLEEALSLFRQDGYRPGICLTLEYLGHAASRQGFAHSTIELYNQALALSREANDENQIAEIIASIGDEYIILGDYDRAEDYFSQAAPICQRLGNRLVGAFIAGKRGFIAMKKGNYPRAFDLLADTILVLQEMGDIEEVILCFEPMAFIAKEQGFPDRAARLLGASESLRKGLGVIRSQSNQADYDTYLADVCNQLGEADFDTAWYKGSTMTYEQAISYAVDRSWQA